jgi:hypothetical protein
MEVYWPPNPLGIGTLLNLAAISPETRSVLARDWWLAPVPGLGAALAVAAADQVFFGGLTMHRTPNLGAHPPVANRVLISFIGSLGEELFFRVGVATAGARLVHLILRRLSASPQAQAQWAGVFIAAAGAGLMQVGQVGNPSDFWRVMTVNVIASTLYGGIYRGRGFELAVLAHITVTGCLYIAVPAFR